MRRLKLLVLVLFCAAGCAAPPASMDPRVALWFGPGSEAYLASREVTLEAVREVFLSMSYEVEMREGALIGTSPVERKYFTLLGDREKSREVRVTLTELAGGRTRVDVSAELIHGPAGETEKERRPDGDSRWVEDFQRAVRKALLERRGSDA